MTGDKVTCSIKNQASTFPFAKFIFQDDSCHKIDLQLQVYFAVWRKAVRRNAAWFGIIKRMSKYKEKSQVKYL